MISAARSDIQNIDNMDDILGGLNEPQYEAVTSSDEALLVLSGAGTGKTRVITSKIAYLLRSFLAYPSQILAVTFSNRAAQEMATRVRDFGCDTDGLWLGTFHAMCAKILRKHAELVGLNSEFSILDTDDQLKLAKQILTEQGRDKKLANQMIDMVGRLKDKCVSFDKVTTLSKEDRDFYSTYQSTLLAYNSADFGDLILYVIKIFQEHDDVLASYRKKFKYILVDEYQDTNLAQYMLLRQLSPYGKGLCCVGDDDQSIYSWRGAEISNILNFANDFPDAKVLKLEQNYRSSGHILGAANGVISCNTSRHQKQLWTEHPAGNKVVVARLDTGYEEANYVAKQICNLKKLNKTLSYKDMAILVRAGYQTREFEDRLLQAGIPYRVIGGPKFYERAEVKDILAYMRVVHHDDPLAFDRIVNLPKRGVGESVLRKLHTIAANNSLSMLDASRRAVNHSLVRVGAIEGLRGLLALIDKWQEMDLSPSELAAQIVEDIDYFAYLPKGAEVEAKKENIEELITALKSYDDLGVFLEHVRLVADSRALKDEDVVTLMTLHSSKGLEFSAVFLCGMEEGIFPNGMSLRDGSLEEERRLAYVGMTRARDALFMTYTINRYMHGEWKSNPPSRFLRELPRQHIFEVK